MPNSISFFGAARTVTGSRHLLETGGKKILVDAGMFQGSRELSQRNWEDFPIPPHEIDAMVLTHAHLDHVGYVPRLVKDGFQGPIYCTRSTLGLSRITLPDSGRIQEEDARYANRRGTRHTPALPLYTEQDAYACLKRFKVVDYGDTVDLPGKAQFRFHNAGHILGSAFAEIFFANGTCICMGGDLGRYDTPIIKDPENCVSADYLVMESTYGDKFHSKDDPKERLYELFQAVMESGGTILIPSFSIGRTQELLYHLKTLEDENRLPRVPVYVDSPMAISATELYRRATSEHDDEAKARYDLKGFPLEPATVTYVRDREQSKELNQRRGPMAIIAGSGMATGGRIAHHILHRASDPTTIILFTGYQAEGTLGRKLLEGENPVYIHNQEVQVAGRVEKLNSLSAHADQGEMLRWLHGFETPPRETFLVHGEYDVQQRLKAKIEEEFGWRVTIPEWKERVSL